MRAVLFLGFVCVLASAAVGGVEETEGNELSNIVASSQLLHRNNRAAEPKKNKEKKNKAKKPLKKRPNKSAKKNKNKSPKNGKPGNKKNKSSKSKRPKSNKSKNKKAKSKRPKSKKSKSKIPKSKRPKSKRPKSKKAKSGGKKTGTKSEKKLKSSRQAACDLTCVTKAIANYIKWGNNLRQNKRITNFVKMSQNKKSKATDFDNSSAILLAYTSNGKDCDGKPPSGDASEAISSLPNCSKTAAALCDVNLDTADQAKVDKCKPKLEAYLDEFQKCYKAAAPTCACFTALPTVDADCETHLEINDKVKKLKDKCISGSEKGSFSACRKLELNLGPVIKQCKPPPTVTTKAPAGRFRNLNLFKFKQFNQN